MQAHEQRLEREWRRDVELLERTPRLPHRLGGRLGAAAVDPGVLGQVGDAIEVDHRPLGPDPHDHQVAIPGGELLEREQDLLPLGPALGALDVLLGLALGQLPALERLLGGRLRLRGPLSGESEDGLRGGVGVEGRVDVHSARDREQLLSPPRRLGVEQPLHAVEPTGRDARERRRLLRREPRRAPLDLRPDRALREPPEGHELAAGADRLRQRPELVGDEDDDRVGRRLLEILSSASAASAFSRCEPKTR